MLAMPIRGVDKKVMHKFLTPLNCSCDAPCRHGAIAITAVRIATGGILLLITLSLKLLAPNEVLIKGALITVMLICGTPVAIDAVRAILRLRFNVQALMTTAVIGAIAIGEFSEAAVVLFLFAIAELLEEASAQRARDALRQLLRLAPNEATVKRNGEEMKVNADDVRIGDVVIVKPGERIPIDGIVISGQAHVNQAPITGEHMPVIKTVGSKVYAGSINVDGALQIKVTHTASESTIARMVRLVEQAELRRAPVEKFVDKFSAYYTPTIVAIAACIAILPASLGYGAFEAWLYRALTLLIISCPCALVISTPVAMVCSLATAARNGVLIKGGIYVEQLASIKVVAFDKTGTLTTGELQVTNIIPLNEHTEEEVLSIAGSLESMSEHPLAQAIVKEAKKRSLNIKRMHKFKAMHGLGATGTIDGTEYFIGHVEFLRRHSVPIGEAAKIAEALNSEGKSTVLLGTREHVCGIIALSDTLRSEAASVIEHLHQHCNKRVVMLTGDNAAAARAVAAELGIEDVRVELMPEDKVRVIQQLIEEYGSTIMVGDGVNDAPAIATATVGIAMGAIGTDIALEAAHVALMSDELEKIPFAIHLSMQAMRIVRFNIAFSILMKALFVALAIAGLATLWMAVAADMGISFIVTANSLRLLTFNPVRS